MSCRDEHAASAPLERSMRNQPFHASEDDALVELKVNGLVGHALRHFGVAACGEMVMTLCSCLAFMSGGHYFVSWLSWLRCVDRL